MADDFPLLVDSFLTQPALLRDDLVTPSSTAQDATVAECLPLLNGLDNLSRYPFDYDERGLKQLDYNGHIAFAEDGLGSFPAPFVSVDASRPWLLNWSLTTLYFLSENPKTYRDRVVKTFYPLQNPNGGYGGGQGHVSHLAATYATVLSLAIVGGEEAYKLTDRKEMWSWLGRLKQADGGFEICEGGEEDTRAAYCALLLIALLDLPWDLPQDAPARTAGLKTFGDGLGEYISRCQTHEGGIASRPGSEAHGAYTFCALAALCLLKGPHVSFIQYLDVDLLLSWLSSRQYAPEGGFAGRTNKVVDGCYSHWIGDCFPLVQAALTGAVESEVAADVGDLYSTDGLERYILNCCQNPDGGLRDKPSKSPDGYHTCYTLSGLSTGEHYHYNTFHGNVLSSFDDPSIPHFESAFSWRAFQKLHREYLTQREPPPFRSQCGLKAVHPVFVIPHDAALAIRAWSTQQRRWT